MNIPSENQQIDGLVAKSQHCDGIASHDRCTIDLLFSTLPRVPFAIQVQPRRVFDEVIRQGAGHHSEQQAQRCRCAKILGGAVKRSLPQVDGKRTGPEPPEEAVTEYRFDDVRETVCMIHGSNTSKMATPRQPSRYGIFPVGLESGGMIFLNVYYSCHILIVKFINVKQFMNFKQ